MTTHHLRSSSQDTPPDADDEAPVDERRAWWTRRRRVVAAVAVGALLVAGVTTTTVAAKQRSAEKTAALETLGRADRDRTSILEPAREVSDTAATALADSDGQVADDSVRVSLSDTVSELDEAIAASVALEVPTADDATDDITAAADALIALNDETKALTETTRKETQVVFSAQRAWRLEEARTAFTTSKTELRDLVAESSVVLAETDGKVTDDQLRVSLSEAIAASTTLLEAEPDLSTADLATLASADMVDAATELRKATTAVQEATAVWSEDMTRQHAANNPPQAQRSGSSASSPSTGTPANVSDSPGPRAPAASTPQQPAPQPAPAPAPAPAPEPEPEPEWTVIEREIPFECDRCGDEYGNTWDC